VTTLESPPQRPETGYSTDLLFREAKEGPELPETDSADLLFREAKQRRRRRRMVAGIVFIALAMIAALIALGVHGQGHGNTPGRPAAPRPVHPIVKPPVPAASTSKAVWSTGTPLAGNQDTSVSCSSPAFCAAIGGGEAFIYSHGTWSSGTPIATDAYSVLSCDSSTFCLALIGPKTYLYNGSGWVLSDAVISTVMPVGSLSCVSRSFCQAGDDGGSIYTFSGSAWSKGNHVISEGISSISCPSVSFCAAVTNTGSAVTFSNGAWSPSHSLGGSSGFSFVSCGSTSSCDAVRGLFAFSYRGGSWSNGQVVTSGQVPTSSLAGISCPTASLCMAGDYAGNVFTESDGVWSPGLHVTGPTEVVALSCGSPSFCVAFGGHPATAFVYADKAR
jgi:hypothetical protein